MHPEALQQRDDRKRQILAQAQKAAGPDRQAFNERQPIRLRQIGPCNGCRRDVRIHFGHSLQHGGIANAQPGFPQDGCANWRGNHSRQCGQAPIRLVEQGAVRRRFRRTEQIQQLPVLGMRRHRPIRARARYGGKAVVDLHMS